MAEELESIGKKSVAWSYAAVFFSVGAGVILYPFVLHYLQPETVAIWNIFQAIVALTVLMDFGFMPSFARNLNYIFSGVRELQVDGVSHNQGCEIDYGLLKCTITAMRKFYGWVTVALFVLLLVVGATYFSCILAKYSGNKTDVVVSWVLFCVINCYNLYTLYYDTLLTGKGHVKKLQQITILGQCIYISVVVLFLYTGFGLVSIVSAQLLSIIIKRILAYKVFYTAELKKRLAEESFEGNPNGVLRIIMPNALKVGLTQLGSFIINKSSIFIGSVYLALSDMAMYGISIQVVDVIARCGTVLCVTYTPRIAQCRVHNDMNELKKIYTLSIAALLSIYMLGGASVLLFGNPLLGLIGSQTMLLPTSLLSLMLIVSLLEQNHSLAAGFIQADNRIPFFIPSLVSGACVVLMIWMLLGVMKFGVLGLILAPGIVQLVYQNWKWPSVLIQEFRQK